VRFTCPPTADVAYGAAAYRGGGWSSVVIAASCWTYRWCTTPCGGMRDRRTRNKIALLRRATGPVAWSGR